MNLKDFLAKNESGTKELYWALVIEPDWIQAGVWEIVESKVDIISVSPPAAWETDEEMIGATDTALSAAIQTLPKETNEPSKTVFGVISQWVSEGQIKDEYLAKIKKICTELSLEPTGFVVLPEAIAHLVKFGEGAPLNAVVLGINGQSIDLAVFRLGNLTGTTSVARSISLADDVTEGLTRFGENQLLPSRILIYDGKEGELEEDRQALLAFDWAQDEKIKFLHTPKIEMIEPEKKVLAVALAGASEIANISEVEGEDSSHLGFLVEEDIAETRVSQVPQEEAREAMPPAVSRETETLPRRTLKPLVEDSLRKVYAFARSLWLKIPRPQFGEADSGKTLALGTGFLAVVVVSFFIFWWYFPRAEVIIYVSPKKIEERATLFVDSKGGSSDFSKPVLAGEAIKTAVSGDKTKATTGTKVVGEKAKGSVKIQNGTDRAINFATGTIIASGNDLKFTLDKTASVSAALSPSEPGTGTVDVTAANIGADYNLAKDERFKVGNYPKAEVDAISVSNFSGGSSHQITAVSAEDQDKLEEDLKVELVDKARQELLANLNPDRLLIAESLETTTSSRVFSDRVGDEATTLKLSLELQVRGLSLVKSDLILLSKEILKGAVPSGFVLRDEELAFSFVPQGTKGSVYEFEVKTLANLLPEIEPGEIAKKIAGKHPSVAESYLENIPGFARAEIRLKPRFPGRLGILPRVLKHTVVEIKGEK